MNQEGKGRTLHYLPYMGSFIVFLGVTHLILFYGAFGISIVNYIEFSEIITSFLDIILIAVLVFITSYIQNFLLWNKTEIDGQDAIRKRIIREDKLLKRGLLYLKFLGGRLISVIVIILIAFTWHFFDKRITYWLILWITIMMLGALIFGVVTVEIERKHYQFNSSVNYQRFTSALLNVLLAIMFVIFYTHSQINGIKKDKITYGVSIVLDNDQVLISDSTNYYVGKTQNFLFIYHEVKNTTDVIPMKRVKQITMTHSSNL